MVEYVKHGLVFFAYERAPANMEGCRTYGEFQRVGAQWSGRELVDLYNAAAKAQGKDAVKRFMNRDAGTKRLWKLVQALPVTPVPEAVANESRLSKKATVLAMVQSPSGATLEELMGATGWQAHSVRGFLSVQRREYTIERRPRTEDVIAYYANKNNPL